MVSHQHLFGEPGADGQNGGVMERPLGTSVRFSGSLVNIALFYGQPPATELGLRHLHSLLELRC